MVLLQKQGPAWAQPESYGCRGFCGNELRRAKRVCYATLCHHVRCQFAMSCPTGYRWSPVRSLPVAPLWCDTWDVIPEQSW